MWDGNLRKHQYLYTLAPFIQPRSLISQRPWLSILSHKSAWHAKDGVTFLCYSHWGKIWSSSADIHGVALGLSPQAETRIWNSGSSWCQLQPQTQLPVQANILQIIPPHLALLKLYFLSLSFAHFKSAKDYTRWRPNPHLLVVPRLICIRWGGKIDTAKS